jgi:hypothetical protein
MRRAFFWALIFICNPRTRAIARHASHEPHVGFYFRAYSRPWRPHRRDSREKRHPSDAFRASEFDFGFSIARAPITPHTRARTTACATFARSNARRGFSCRIYRRRAGARRARRDARAVIVARSDRVRRPATTTCLARLGARRPRASMRAVETTTTMGRGTMPTPTRGIAARDAMRRCECSTCAGMTTRARSDWRIEG